jgi:hypothetical protein
VQLLDLGGARATRNESIGHRRKRSGTAARAIIYLCDKGDAPNVAANMERAGPTLEASPRGVSRELN